MATRQHTRAVDAAPHRGAPKVTGRIQLYDCHKKTAELLTPYPTKFGIPVELEATTTSKEVQVRHPAPPGISPFFYRTSMRYNERTKWPCHSNLPCCEGRAKRAGCGRARSRNIFFGHVLIAVRQGQQRRDATAAEDLRHGRCTAGERHAKKANLTETTHTAQAPCTPRLPTQSILFCVLIRAQRNARTHQPAALAFVPYGFVLVRVRSAGQSK
jgi:hypothetical protein